MAFNPDAPSGTEATMADLWAAIRGNFGDHEDRLQGIENAEPGALRDEVEAARGGKATLADRLATALDDDGYLRFESLKQAVWAETGLTPTYVSSTSITVPGDAEARFPQGMTLRLDLGGGEYAYTQVSSASYDGSTKTTIGVKDAVVTAGLAAVALGVAVFNSQASQVDVAEGGRLPAQDLQSTLELLDREDVALAQTQAQAVGIHVETLSANTTLGAVTGKTYQITAAVTLTLPPAAETPEGWWCRLVDASGSAVMLSTQGGDTIDGDTSAAITGKSTVTVVRISNSGYLLLRENQNVLQTREVGSAAFAQADALAPGVWVETLSANTTLGAVTGKSYRASTDAITLTLPPAAETPDGWWCRIKHRSGGATGVTVAAQGGDTIDGVASVTMTDGEVATITRTGASSYEVF